MDIKGGKNPGFVHVVWMSKLDIYDMTRKPVKWSEIDLYSSLEDIGTEPEQDNVSEDKSDAIEEKDGYNM